MTLYKGSKKIAPIINKATTVHNQDLTVVENGVYTFDDGHTGLGEVTVNVPDPIIEEAQPLVITENGEYLIEKPEHIDGYNRMEVHVNVPILEKAYEVTEEDLNNNILEIMPDEGSLGMTKVVIDLSLITRLLSEI